MKKIYGFIAMLLLFVSCDDKLDIVPKGKTTLDNISDLENSARTALYAFVDRLLRDNVWQHLS